MTIQAQLYLGKNNYNGNNWLFHLMLQEQAPWEGGPGCNYNEEGRKLHGFCKATHVRVSK